LRGSTKIRPLIRNVGETEPSDVRERGIGGGAASGNAKGFLPLEEALQIHLLEAAYAEMEASGSNGRNAPYNAHLKVMQMSM
jgi:hypothetical protein